jgi:hypothetical protein
VQAAARFDFAVALQMSACSPASGPKTAEPVWRLRMKSVASPTTAGTASTSSSTPITARASANSGCVSIPGAGGSSAVPSPNTRAATIAGSSPNTRVASVPALIHSSAPTTRDSIVGKTVATMAMPTMSIARADVHVKGTFANPTTPLAANHTPITLNARTDQSRAPIAPPSIAAS